MNPARSPDVVLVGHPFAPIGMGEHVRCGLAAFRAAGVDARARDIFGLNDRTDPAFERSVGPHMVSQLSPRLNVFHINGDEVPLALAHVNEAERFDRAYNVIYPAWELSRYPKTWVPHLERFDEIWAPSEFIRAAIADAVDRPVFHMPLAVDLSLHSFVGRRGLGLPEHAFIYFFLFDFSSYMERKNPFAVLEAFDRLVQRHPRAPLHLVLKHKGGEASPGDLERFKRAISKHRDQIQILDRTLTDTDVKNLVREANCFVSLHRSEGFGRGMAEAMALGVPTIATGYSGNLDFMTENNSFMVRHALIPVAKGAYVEGEGQVWAEPDIAHAVDLMEQVYLDRRLARAKAAQAAKDLRRLFSPLAVGLRYAARQEQILHSRTAGGRG